MNGWMYERVFLFTQTCVLGHREGAILKRNTYNEMNSGNSLNNIWKKCFLFNNNYLQRSEVMDRIKIKSEHL